MLGIVDSSMIRSSGRLGDEKLRSWILCVDY
jgi:hypothetical protein